MQNAKDKITIIIPVKRINDYLREETIPALLGQTCQDFEIVIVIDERDEEKFPKTTILVDSKKSGPADKRDLGTKIAKGEILAFLDDDSYPAKSWLENALKIFDKDDHLAGVGGPTLTPRFDNVLQQASGYVWSTRLGSGGAGTYRCKISQRREVDDYPTVNFLVRKKDFLRVGGFNSHFWPGEDTKLCHDLVYKLGKKIIYDPEVVVYHHRRPVFKAHLQQISRYAIHRGYFAKVLPKTSLRLGYFFPTFFVLGFIGGMIGSLVLKPLLPFYLLVLSVYFFLLLLTSLRILLLEKNLKLGILVAISIFMTHLTYGILFAKGFLSPSLKR